MWRGVLVACLAGCSLCGCIGSVNSVNYAAADAMGYSRLAADAARHDNDLASAIRRISRSPEHQHMQGVISGLPANMDGCLIIEMADVGEAEEITPAILGLFVTADSIGFLSNFAFDDSELMAPAGGEWRAAVWPSTDDPKTLLPDSPADLLPGADVQGAQSSKGTVIILTLVNRDRVLSLAIWDDGEFLSTGERLVRFLPEGLRKYLPAKTSHALPAIASSWRNIDACLD